MSTPSHASISDKAFTDGSVKENLNRLRQHGFTHLHLSYAWREPDPLTPEQIEALQRDLEETGMRVLDVHGCHPKGINLWEEDEEARRKALDLFLHRLHVTHSLGGDAMVYHVPAHVEPTDVVIDRFLDGLARAEETARALGIKVALENHFLLENDRRAFSAAFERFSDTYIGFTFDPGHANRSGNMDWLLDNCFDRLTILHLNDNDVVKDRHWLPFQEEGSVDWQRALSAIAASPYTKPLQLEVAWRSDIHETHEEFLADAARRFTKLTEIFAALRSAPQAEAPTA